MDNSSGIPGLTVEQDAAVVALLQQHVVAAMVQARSDALTSFAGALCNAFQWDAAVLVRTIAGHLANQKLPGDVPQQIARIRRVMAAAHEAIEREGGKSVIHEAPAGALDAIRRIRPPPNGRG